jgi:hypothetical protein
MDPALALRRAQFRASIGLRRTIPQAGKSLCQYNSDLFLSRASNSCIDAGSRHCNRAGSRSAPRPPLVGGCLYLRADIVRRNQRMILKVADFSGKIVRKPN